MVSTGKRRYAMGYSTGVPRMGHVIHWVETLLLYLDPFMLQWLDVRTPMSGVSPVKRAISPVPTTLPFSMLFHCLFLVLLLFMFSSFCSLCFHFFLTCYLHFFSILTFRFLATCPFHSYKCSLSLSPWLFSAANYSSTLYSAWLFGVMVFYPVWGSSQHQGFTPSITKQYSQWDLSTETHALGQRRYFSLLAVQSCYFQKLILGVKPPDFSVSPPGTGSGQATSSVSNVSTSKLPWHRSVTVSGCFINLSRFRTKYHPHVGKLTMQHPPNCRNTRFARRYNGFQPCWASRRDAVADSSWQKDSTWSCESEHEATLTHDSSRINPWPPFANACGLPRMYSSAVSETLLVPLVDAKSAVTEQGCTTTESRNADWTGTNHPKWKPPAGVVKRPGEFIPQRMGSASRCQPRE